MNYLSKFLGINRLFESIQCLKESFLIIEEKQKTILNKINDIESELKPKPFPDSFKLLNPVTEEEIFYFDLLKPEEVIVDNLVEIDKNPTHLLQLLGSIPNFYSTGMLANSFRFSFPNGISGNVMNIGSGYGTAITNGSGQILGHGTYLSNFMIAAPLFAYQAVDFIIKQHYLAKINENLKEINERLNTLIEIEFIKKEVKIESIIIFFKRVYQDFDDLNNNKNYKNAILSNIISKNIEIQELIFFYQKTFKSIDKKNTSEIIKTLSYLVILNDLFVYGKILEFKYSGHFNKKSITDLKTDCNSSKESYNKFFKNNSEIIEANFEKIKHNWAERTFVFNFFGYGSKKTQEKYHLKNSIKTMEEMQTKNNEIFDKNIPLLDDLLEQMTQPLEFIISEGKVYKQKKLTEGHEIIHPK